MDIFNALAVPNRRKIVEMLAREGQLSATVIADKFKVSAPAISQHLKVLREADIIEMQKNAQQRLYTINPKKMQELEHWAQHLAKQWSARFDRLDAVLEVEKSKILKNFNIKAAKSSPRSRDGEAGGKGIK